MQTMSLHIQERNARDEDNVLQIDPQKLSGCRLCALLVLVYVLIEDYVSLD